MSIRKIFFVGAIISSAMISACSNDPAAVVAGPPEAVEPTSPSVLHDRGFIWSIEDGFKEIPTPSYAQAMSLTGVNNLGQVIGYLTLHDGQGDDRGFIWSTNDGLQRLGSLVGPDGISRPLTIDDDGKVWGFSDGPSTRSDAASGLFTGQPVLRDPFVWSASSGIEPAAFPVNEGPKLTLPTGTDCIGDIVRTTTAGFAIGYVGTGEDGLFCATMYAVMWDVNGAPVVIGEPCERMCAVRLSDINNRGEVVGSYTDGEGFRWTRSGGFVRFPVETGHVGRINDNGDVAGAIETGTALKPFVWTASGEIKMIELPALATEGFVVAINNRGQVVGGFR